MIAKHKNTPDKPNANFFVTFSSSGKANHQAYALRLSEVHFRIHGFLSLNVKLGFLYTFAKFKPRPAI